MIFEDGFGNILVVLGAQFRQLFDNIWCLEEMFNEKDEHVFSVDSYMCSKDFQVPQGTEMEDFGENMTS